jgi:hypothetical protein
MLPPMLDTDEMRALEPRGAHFFNSLVAPVHIYWALLRMFAVSWARQTVLMVLYSCAMLCIPVGSNHLLGYVERGGIDARVRPWVWILLFGGAPLLQSLADDLYLYYNARTAAQISALLKGAISRHALRIRVTHASPDKNEHFVPSPTLAPSGVPLSATSTASPDMDTAEPLEPAAEHTLETTTSHSCGDSSTTAVSLVASQNSATGGKDNSEGRDEKKTVAPKMSDIIGRLNVLVTSDLENIVEGADWIRGLLGTMLPALMGSWSVAYLIPGLSSSLISS